MKKRAPDPRRVGMSLRKFHMLVSLRLSETHPDRPIGHACKITSGDVATARSAAGEGLAIMGRCAPPAVGNTVALTKAGREFVDKVLTVAKFMHEEKSDA